MTSKEFDSRKPSHKTDDFIQDYLSDIWGSPADSTINDSQKSNNLESKPTPRTLEKLSVPKNIRFNVIERAVEYDYIPLEHALVPTIKLHTYTDNLTVESQVECMIVLLTNLYFLRRTLPPKTRMFILALSEKTIDDFNALYWMQLPPKVGAKYEV